MRLQFDLDETVKTLKSYPYGLSQHLFVNQDTGGLVFVTDLRRKYHGPDMGAGEVCCHYFAVSVSFFP